MYCVGCLFVSLLAFQHPGSDFKYANYYCSFKSEILDVFKGERYCHILMLYIYSWEVFQIG